MWPTENKLDTNKNLSLNNFEIETTRDELSQEVSKILYSTKQGLLHPEIIEQF